MCVAIYKPKGIKAPSIETLKKCWDANPDGAGLAWRTSGKYPVHIEKGFMTWKEFVSYWTSLNFANYDDDMFIHFRITTHGGTCPSNTHPFPIADNDTLLGAHLVGHNVTEMIAEPTIARALGAKAKDLAYTIHPHPTMSEGVMSAAFDYIEKR